MHSLAKSKSTRVGQPPLFTHFDATFALCCQRNNETICSSVDICISQWSRGRICLRFSAPPPHQNAQVECAKDFAMDPATSTTSQGLNSATRAAT
ncbi:LOW QUALITY PROTEIN: uncharacterized protein [Drosophila kikkawai]|uniref:LOW QUALITY PROTEIN: uncharacterized protein n=1 Tax=Drosophila kikkawai TaxID=30033 RepID=A0A6P4J976_DROKI|nr:LOW QUALITY PROTEIN: uncharacterized protein LOC108085790 [Drosophila kikkawai]